MRIVNFVKIHSVKTTIRKALYPQRNLRVYFLFDWINRTVDNGA
jgi:hypothetical protein